MRLFRHPNTKVKLLLWVDDNLMRGRKCHTDELWDDIDAKFGLKHRVYVDYGVSRTFIGINPANGTHVEITEQTCARIDFLSFLRGACTRCLALRCINVTRFLLDGLFLIIVLVVSGRTRRASVLPFWGVVIL